ncbi:MAG: tRNA uridine-5-carboxymethylaminomethyl(34) synthesis enzyme MnmG, partial [Gammaproteobacteria bacterium]|nr:tRNA uridine-5-carboxymethylaminomethyl(34) synthesis enzyme MnmG [Gammaproteobacteria bacterium]
IVQEQQRLKSTIAHPGKIADGRSILPDGLSREQSLLDLLRRPEVDYEGLVSLIPGMEPVADRKVSEQVTIQAKYAGYIERQQLEIEKQRRHEETRLPETIDYSEVRGLSNEVAEKFAKVRPATIGQASRISGVTPAAISILLVHLKKQKGG